MNLGVNIDHVATLREARGGVSPDPCAAAVLCELAGAQGITFHLREDRRHIKERDVKLLKELIQVKLNMEMAATDGMTALAVKFKPEQATIVPEKRQELTTEGGLDVAHNKSRIKNIVNKLQSQNIKVSLFIDPEPEQIDAGKMIGVSCVELHTGEYANARGEVNITRSAKKLETAAGYAHSAGLEVYAGHGLNYHNVASVAGIHYIEELNIGHSVISRAVFTGLENAVREMLALI